MCLDIFNLTFDEMLLLKAQYAKKVSTEHRSLRPLRNPNKMILTALDLLEGVSVYDRILGLAFLSGRRVAEIACTAKCQPLRKDWILFDGQLKVKEKLTGTYEIPLLAESSLIVDGIRRLRQERPQWVDQPILFHDRGSPALSVRVKKHFSPFIDTPTVKDLRAAYAEICYDRFGSIRIAKSRFFSDILGHGEDDNLTGQSYIDFYIDQEAA
jgi:integrase